MLLEPFLKIAAFVVFEEYFGCFMCIFSRDSKAMLIVLHPSCSTPEQAGRDDQRAGGGHDGREARAGVHGSAGEGAQSK